MIEQQKLPDFINNINNIFGLQKQARELVTLIARATGSKNVGLLFLDTDGEGFSTLSCFPKPKTNPFSRLRFERRHPIVKYLNREQRLLVGENLAKLPGLRRFQEHQIAETSLDKIALLIPLISRDQLIGILALEGSDSGKYSNEDYNLLTEVTSLVAVSLEKEYLREQLTQQKEELTKLYAEAEERSHIDGMTGLFNRRALDEALASEIGRYSRYGGIFSLIIFDLDGALRTANNRYGHPAGDELLKKIGLITMKMIRNSDQAFRIYGGDEFAILLPSTPIDAAGRVAERLRKQLASELKVDKDPVTASFGVASWPAHGKDAATIFAAADAALYKAKRKGGNEVRTAASP